MSKRLGRPPSLLASAEADQYGAVYRWLKRHYRQISNLRKASGTPWPAIARRMESEGIRNKAGGPVTRQLAHYTWTRLEADFAKAAKMRAGDPSTRDRSSRSSVEPPSRPGVNYRVDRPRTLAIDAPSIGREPQHDNRHQLGPSAQAAQQRPNRPLTAEEKFARADEALRRADGYQPKPRNRGPVE